MAEISTIARPYAHAIFDLAQEDSQLAQWSDTLQFCAAVATDSQMQQLIRKSDITKEQLLSLFLDIGAKQLDDLGQNMLKLLVENNRLHILPEIASQYESLKAEAEKTIEAEIVAAYEVSSQEQTSIAAKLAKRLGRAVNLTCRVDASLVGGAMIKAGDMVIDGSTVGQIQKLSVELAN